MNSENKLKQETIVNHLKNYGFVYPGSEIYGGLSNTWDYGPVGVLLKNNIKKLIIMATKKRPRPMSPTAGLKKKKYGCGGKIYKK